MAGDAAAPGTGASAAPPPPPKQHLGLPNNWEDMKIIPRSGALHWFHPTSVHMRKYGRKLTWHARGHRKGRHSHIAPIEGEAVLKLRYWLIEPGNISWWVAIIFTLGSVSWVINGFFLMWPLSSESRNLDVTAWSAFSGGTLFEVGASLAYLEAINVDHDDEFGDAIEAVAENAEEHVSALIKRNVPLGSRSNVKAGFRWHGADWHSLGFVAAVVQEVAATVFWMSTITGIPGVLPTDNVSLENILYWTPQVVGGAGFIIASVLLMYEEQPKWWRIQPRRLGWQVGLWNLIGAVGFMLSGVFGYWKPVDRYQKWGTAFSSFWGGWAFLVGSVIQYIEAINPHPSDHNPDHSSEENNERHRSSDGAPGSSHEACAAAPTCHVNQAEVSATRDDRSDGAIGDGGKA